VKLEFDRGYLTKSKFFFLSPAAAVVVSIPDYSLSPFHNRARSSVSNEAFGRDVDKEVALALFVTISCLMRTHPADPGNAQQLRAELSPR